MSYVNHICKNKKCNNNWIDKDLTSARSLAPSWKYCKECCERLGIDFDAQRPSDHMSDIQKKSMSKNLKKKG